MPGGPDDPAVERVVWALQDPAAAKALADSPPIQDEADFTTLALRDEPTIATQRVSRTPAATRSQVVAVTPRSRSRYFSILPVGVLGISSTTST